MSEENSPYNLNNIGEDPLHVVLKQDLKASRTNPLYIYDGLPVLMKFNPEIDEHNLSRMALLEYIATYNYLKIIQQYPRSEPIAVKRLPDIKF
ncbi:MAG: hypothetical protein ACI89W_000213 [Gammaproteobacteria bacterium]|jgi:hypothetical protein